MQDINLTIKVQISAQDLQRVQDLQQDLPQEEALLGIPEALDMLQEEQEGLLHASPLFFLRLSEVLQALETMEGNAGVRAINAHHHTNSITARGLRETHPEFYTDLQ